MAFSYERTFNHWKTVRPFAIIFGIGGVLVLGFVLVAPVIASTRAIFFEEWATQAAPTAGIATVMYLTVLALMYAIV